MTPHLKSDRTERGTAYLQAAKENRRSCSRNIYLAHSI